MPNFAWHWLASCSGACPAWCWRKRAFCPVPALTARVIDQTGTLSATDKAALEAKLAAYEQNKGSQIVVLMVPTTQPEDIAAYAHRVASDWKIGRRDVGDDGMLLIVAKDDRRMRIEVARALRRRPARFGRSAHSRPHFAAAVSPKPVRSKALMPRWIESFGRLMAKRSVGADTAGRGNSQGSIGG